MPQFQISEMQSLEITDRQREFAAFDAGRLPCDELAGYSPTALG